MLTVTIPSTGTKFGTYCSQLVYDYGFYSSSVKKEYHHCVGFQSGSYLGTVFQLEGQIATGKPDSFNERGCVHRNIEGSIILSDSITKEEKSLNWPYDNPGFKIGTLYTNGVVSPGNEFSYGPVSYYLKRKIQKSEFMFYAKMTDDRRIWVTAVRATPSSPIFANVHCSWYSQSLNVAGSDVRTSIEMSSFDEVSQYNYDLITVPRGTLAMPGSLITPGNYEKFKRHALGIVGSQYLFNLDSIAVESDLWGELAVLAVNSTRYVNTNGIQFLTELRSAKSVLGSIFRSKATTKGMAQAYLACKYGTGNQLMDFESYLRASQRSLRRTDQPIRVVRSSLVDQVTDDIRTEYHYKIFYKHYDNDVLRAIETLDRWSLMPNMTMVWDLIPYSFVIGWFTDIERIFRNIDFETRSQMFKVLSVTRSSKTTIAVKAGSALMPSNFYGSLQYSVYRRSTQRKLDKPLATYVPPSEFNNTVELTALLLSKQRK